MLTPLVLAPDFAFLPPPGPLGLALLGGPAGALPRRRNTTSRRGAAMLMPLVLAPDFAFPPPPGPLGLALLGAWPARCRGGEKRPPDEAPQC